MESTSARTIRLLIIAGEEDTRSRLLEYFQTSPYQTTTVGVADTALRYLSDCPGYDAAFLDRCLPEQTGFDLLETVQEMNTETAFLLLTSRSCLEDKLYGFELGADDYVERPFAMEELEARLQAVLRRSPASSPPTDEGTYTLNDLTINFGANTCFRGDQRVSLTSLEFMILKYIVEHRGQIVTREELRDAVWTDREDICLRTVDRHVAKIREKLERDPNVPAFLQTVYGKGYKFACAEYA